MNSCVVYNKSEQFKQGCIAGLYDAKSDDGLRYLDDILRYGVEGREDRAEFLAGYRAGRALRSGQPLHDVLSRDSVPAAA
jgi:hypothetical protein